jgi:hypothetical protein
MNRDGGMDVLGDRKKSYSLGAIQGGQIKKTFRYVGQSKYRLLYGSIVFVDNIGLFCHDD